ncbi:hypothetical protein SK128_025274 [Halocaridina rubra]|uniref:Uncharacterized protein n=1 Tax=Halocaridina rubra TaxID=373956 RepID=A0AAN8WIA0_HALRR
MFERVNGVFGCRTRSTNVFDNQIPRSHVRTSLQTLVCRTAFDEPFDHVTPPLRGHWKTLRKPQHPSPNPPLPPKNPPHHQSTEILPPLPPRRHGQKPSSANEDVAVSQAVASATLRLQKI